MATPENTTSLSVGVTYDKEADLIIITFDQDGRLITIGFDVHEAQAFNYKIAEAVTDAILNRHPPYTGTKH